MLSATHTLTSLRMEKTQKKATEDEKRERDEEINVETGRMIEREKGKKWKRV